MVQKKLIFKAAINKIKDTISQSSYSDGQVQCCSCQHRADGSGGATEPVFNQKINRRHS